MLTPAPQTTQIIIAGAKKINKSININECFFIKTQFFFSCLLYVKLFILMGGTWLMEFISWAVGGPHEYWILTDLINCSRGVLIFLICVVCNAKIRHSLLSRVTGKNYHAGGIDQSSSINSFAATIEFINIKNKSWILKHIDWICEVIFVWNSERCVNDACALYMKNFIANRIIINA